MRAQLPKFLFVLASFAALAVFPHVAGNFGVDLATKIMIFAVLALSLELLVGKTGLVCFGQAAFFGIGAYATVLLSPSDGPASVATLLPLCVLLAAAYALVRKDSAPTTKACISLWLPWPLPKWPITSCMTRLWAVVPTVFT